MVDDCISALRLTTELFPTGRARVEALEEFSSCSHPSSTTQVKSAQALPPLCRVEASGIMEKRDHGHMPRGSDENLATGFNCLSRGFSDDMSGVSRSPGLKLLDPLRHSLFTGFNFTSIAIAGRQTSMHCIH
jgi:hypothetical protein